MCMFSFGTSYKLGENRDGFGITGLIWMLNSLQNKIQIGIVNRLADEYRAEESANGNWF